MIYVYFTLPGSFYIDLKQITQILNDSTNRSLVLIDEFGKGTLTHGRNIIISIFFS